MTPERWQRIGALFEAARENPPDARIAFLDDACAGDPALRREVEALLAAVDGADDYFAGLAERAGVPPFAAAAPGIRPAPDPPQSLEGRRFLSGGFYRIVRELGRGGMGAVYLAERAQGPFHRQVALKVVKRGMDSDLILQRFLRERQILARLQHPHIARLYDGGLSDDGRPYFAMEYVDGVPLTDYCDARRLDVEARLRLFIAVGEAVHYAHSNLVVHRDLKPSNVLVTGEGRVKLLDFGIAKLLGGDEDEEVLTRTGMQVMTPAYAAPEQVRGGPITTATDVYALGAVLYELLTGHRPVHLAGRSTEEMIEAVLNEQPERPSTVIGRTREQTGVGGTPETVTPEGLSRARGTQVDRLRRRLAGDLDTVCLMALRKEPERRYASAEAFVEDVKRHLAGLPVTAQRDTTGYRLRKFVGRHKVVVVASLLAVLSLLGGLAVAVWQAGVAARERDVARQEAEKAEQVTEFMVSIFEGADPSEARGDSLSAYEILDRGAQRIEEELAEQPAVRAKLLDVLGRVYHSLGYYDQAQAHLQRALNLRRDLLGPEHLDIATSLHRMASLLDDRGRYDEAEAFYREALQMGKNLSEEDESHVIESLNGLAVLHYNTGDYDTAARYFEETLALERELLGDDHPNVTGTLNNLATVIYAKGDYDEAARRYREVVALERKLLGDDHPDLLISLNNVAMMLYMKGDYDEAEAIHREVLAAKRKVLGSDHPAVASSLNNLALVLQKKGHYDDAERSHREALAIKRERLGTTHPSVAYSMTNLAVVLYEKDNYEEAEPLLREALVLRRTALGDEHPDVAITLHRLALVLHKKGKRRDAETLHREALRIYRNTLPEDHAYIAEVLIGLGRLWLDQGRQEEAEPVLREGLGIRKEVYGDADRRTAEAKMWLGACLAAQSRFEEAETLLLEGYSVLQTGRGEQHEGTQQIREALAALYTAWGKPAQAAPFTAPPAQ